MKKIIAAAAIVAALLAFHTEVHASCVTNTIFAGGRTTFCTTCCYSGMCTTTCY